MASFQLLPAIDLLDGRVVRLRHGDFADQTAYSIDPLGVATAFLAAGATWLHVVDLDGARDAALVNAGVIRRLLTAVGDRASVEVAGGLRSESAVAEVLSTGAARAVVGTAALEESSFAARILRTHGTDQIAVAIDVRDGLAVGRGWVSGAQGTPVRQAITDLANEGVRWFEVTAIARDGTLEGPDLDLLRIAVAEPRARVIASGGISTLADLAAVREIGCAGAIVGRALYDGTLSLEAALQASSG